MKISLSLRQHTPLIHFQYEEDGATLRATELKPKLDKYLREQYFDFRDKYAHLLIGGDKNTNGAFDYKIQIEVPERSFKDIIKTFGDTSNSNRPRFPNFFADLGDDWQNNQKQFVWTEGDIQINIHSFHSELLQIIDKVFPRFLMRHNFGMRQSKGFGSFYLKDTSNLKSDYYFDVAINQHDSYGVKMRRVFDEIELFYKSLRSGINLNGRFYFKSLLFLYAKSQGWQWEKKTIKETFFNDYLRTQERNHNRPDIISYQSSNKKLVKDLFGLSTNESWLSYRGKITKENNEIDRFKSPLLFKPINMSDTSYRVFFCVDTYSKEIFDREFVIKNNDSGNLKIKTPERFSFTSFFDFIFDKNNFDIDSHVEQQFHRTREFKILNNIYNQLQK